MSKVIRQRGRFLSKRRQVHLALVLAWLALAAVLTLVSRSPLGLLPLVLIPGSIRLYIRYSKGETGESLVNRALEALDDTYYVVHDVQLSSGNVDHVVLGPNGIFVLETKHHSGLIYCRGDHWWRGLGVRAFKVRSPSLQAKRNSALVRERLESFEESLLKGYPRVTWVHAVVVFTNPEVLLKLGHTTVPVVYLDQLVDAITTVPSRTVLPAAALTMMSLALLGMKDP